MIQYIIVIFDLAYGCARGGSLPHPTETPSPGHRLDIRAESSERIPPAKEEKRTRQREEAGAAEAAGDREIPEHHSVVSLVVGADELHSISISAEEIRGSLVDLHIQKCSETVRRSELWSPPEQDFTPSLVLEDLLSCNSTYRTDDRCIFVMTIPISSEDNMTDLLNKSIQKTTIGVFGKTGDGKSSLINAILDEEELLPTGTLDACTSVIIQVEAGAERDQYTATIEFISKEAWEDELKSLLGFLAERKERDETIGTMAEDKIEALYGKNATAKSFDELMNDDRSPVIATLLRLTTKTISKFQASDLSEAIRPYIQHHESDLGGFYWPLVKTVRIKVPDHKGFLQNIVLVDLPGNGDCNQTRDEMWKSMLRECTAVWVVSDINRATSDKSAWEILKSSMTDMVQGGACTRISFICTKTDNIDPQSYIGSKRNITSDAFQCLL
ncbi:nuclear GTPase SLIP-GC-like [Osmerus mordax]|uniref:nuclear GTPase SLIP-GC-like n=1 Tax=Osmerus mordax TaxID=8014 RepID=UPI00350EDF37